MFDDPTFINATELAQLFGVSRMTVHRWRLAGFLPKPVYTADSVTLWREDDLFAWYDAGLAAGALPMGNPEVAGLQLAERGAAAVAELCRHSSPNAAEAEPHCRRLLDRLERSLNRCSLLVEQADDVALEDRFHTLRAAVTAAAERFTDGPETTAEKR